MNSSRTGLGSAEQEVAILGQPSLLQPTAALQPQQVSLAAALAAVAVGSMVGAGLRWGITHVAGENMWATWGINVLGCAALGWVMVWLSQPHLAVKRAWWHLLLVTGGLGGFTTFSAYTVGVARLIAAHQLLAAWVYLVATVVAALLAVFLGQGLGRWWWENRHSRQQN